MARKYARIKGTVWTDDDWREITPQAQWAYFMLISQPQITNCGVLPYLPVRWARLARGLTLHSVRVLLGELEQHRFIVVDEDAGELLIRSYIRHDGGVEKIPNVLAAVLREYEAIESRLIKHALACEYPDHFTYDGPDPSIHLAQLPLMDDRPNDRPNERQDDRPNDAQGTVLARGSSSFNVQRSDSSSSARAREPHPEQPAAESPNGEVEPPLAQLLAAEPIAWKAWQITKGTSDPHRCRAWIDAALQRHGSGEIENPGGWAWTRFGENGWPDRHEQPRSAYPDPSKVCPDCGEKLGHGHLETCPRMPTVAPEPDDDPEPELDPEPRVGGPAVAGGSAVTTGAGA